MSFNVLVVALSTPIPTPIQSTYNSTSNYMPKVDVSFNLAAIIALSSILSAVLVALINNIYQLRMKSRELKHQESMNLQQNNLKIAEHLNANNMKTNEYNSQKSFKEMENDYLLKKYQWETYYKSATETYTNMLANVGQYLADPSNLTQYEKAIPSIYQTFAYADDDLNLNLRELINYLHDLANLSQKPMLKEYTLACMETCATLINTILTKSMK